MKSLVIVFAFLISPLVFAECPNLSGRYIGDLEQDVIQITQTDCSQLTIAYSPDTSSPLTAATYVTDNVIRSVDNGHFQKSSWNNDSFVTQLFSDSEGTAEAGPKRAYSLYTTATSSWLRVETYIDSFAPITALYKKQQ